MTTVILHIGVHKTGTTSIQKFLKINQKTLKQSGFAFPLIKERDNHVHLHIYAMDNHRATYAKKIVGLMNQRKLREFRQSFPDDFKATLDEFDGCETFILSAEGLAFLHKKTEIDRLSSLLRPHFDEIKVVVYLRRQDEVAISMYQQAIKGGNVPTRMFRSHISPGQIYDFKSLLQAYEGLCGKENIIIRRYGFPEGAFNAVDDFCQAIGIDQTGLTQPGRKNERSGAKAIEYLLEFNKRFPAFNRNQPVSPFRGNILEVIKGLKSGDGTPFDKHDAAAFLEKCSSINNWVSENYLDGEPLFPAPEYLAENHDSDDAQSLDDNDLTKHDAMEISFLIWEAYINSLHVNKAELRFKQGLLERERGRLDLAVMNFKATLKLDPSHVRAKRQLKLCQKSR